MVIRWPPRGAPTGRKPKGLSARQVRDAYKALRRAGKTGNPPTQEKVAEKLDCSDRLLRYRLKAWGLSWPPAWSDEQLKRQK
jgi:hypothetical protein